MSSVQLLTSLSPDVPAFMKGNQKKKEVALRRYAGLVKYVVEKIASGLPRCVDVDDLLDAAVIGLMDALEKFDPDKGIKFETYAVWRVKGAVLDELRAMDWVPRTTRRKARFAEATARTLDQKLGRAATQSELASALGMTPGEHGRLMEEIRGSLLIPIERTVSKEMEPDQGGLEETIEDENSPDPEALLEKEETVRLLEASIEKLPEQERLVVALYYYEDLTLKEIGEALQISESRVSQIHGEAMKKLKTRLGRKLSEVAQR